MGNGWIGVDFDGTLAKHSGEWDYPEPVRPMLQRVRNWLDEGVEVRVVTARACRNDAREIEVVQNWTERHLGVRLPVTAMKDYGMIELWDDRAVRVVRDKGQIDNSYTERGRRHG